MANPRIDDLRKRVEKDPQSRLFAQLAEELRKDGDLAEAIQVAREGLARHPQYPSARLTLGRALMDTGDTRSAARELEAAVKGAPDNLLASRLLGECLEAEGQLEAALDRYRTTMNLGDRQIAPKIEALQNRMRKPPMATASTAQAKPTAAPAAGPVPLVDAEEHMELEAAHERASSFVVRGLDEDEDLFDAGEADEPPPIPLVEASEEFELERPYDALAARAPIPMPALAPEDVAAARDPAPAMPAIPDAELLPLEPEPEVDPAPAPDLNSSTLAELYFNQGFTDQAIDVYRRLADREPGSERVQARLRELEALQRHLDVQEAAPPPPEKRPADAAGRRAAIERTIARLEGLQAALRKG